MKKDRKEHRKQKRLAGEREKKRMYLLNKQRLIDSEVLQSIKRAADEMGLSPADLRKAFEKMADSEGKDVESFIKDGVTVINNKGEKTFKTSQDILQDIFNTKRSADKRKNMRPAEIYKKILNKMERAK